MSYSADSPILGKGTVSAEAIQAWLESQVSWGARVVGLPPTVIPVDMGQIIVEESARYPGTVVNHDLVAAQINHESAACQSRIARDKNNYSGYGAENDDPYGKAFTFSTPRDGVRTQIAHLLGYVLGDGKWNALSPRYSIVQGKGWDGAVTVLHQLEQRWAYTGAASYAVTPKENRYGAKIATHANRLLAFANDGSWNVATPYEEIIPGLIDVRSKLATRSPEEGGVERGPYERIPLSEKRGVVIHYRGVVTAATAGLSSYQADAEYHVGKNWVGAGQTPVLGSGIMYHIGVDGEGNGYLMRDLDRVLWHCGAWPQNSNTLAIQLPLGGSQRATAAQLTRTREIIDAWLRYTGAPRNEVWGHGQLSSTPCPGTLINDLVTPYRNAVTPPAPQPPAPKPNAADEVTGKWIHEEFATTYATYGGLYVFGRPSTGAFMETHDDRERLTQYFERATFRFFPENQGEWRVQLDLLGVTALNERYPDGAPA